jgi:hypothetical protein
MADTAREAIEKAFDEQEVPDVEENSGSDEKGAVENGGGSGDGSGDASSGTENGAEDPKSDDNEESGTEEKPLVDGLTEDEIKAAGTLYKMLNDPKTADETFAYIAQKSGYKLERMTQAQQDAVADEIDSVMREMLGEDFALLPTNFSKALNKIIEAKIGNAKAKLETIEQRFEAEAVTRHRQSVNIALEAALNELPDMKDEKFQSKLLAEMQEFPPKPGADLKVYIEKMYRLAGGTPKAANDAARNQRAKSNLDGVKPSDSVREGRSTKANLTLKDAIAAAYDELNS